MSRREKLASGSAYLLITPKRRYVLRKRPLAAQARIRTHLHALAVSNVRKILRGAAQERDRAA